MGLDSAKEEMDPYESIFLARGLATLAFDGPGQGEGEYELAIRGDYEVPVRSVLDFVERRGDGAYRSAATMRRGPPRSISA
jgi:2,6-dihydroxypseudooxynicotine hydrolase